MNPKLNVWLLHHEHRKLVLRNEHGRIIRAATSEGDKRKLRNEYERYNKHLRTQDVPASKTLRRKIASKVAVLKKHGFTQSLILYRTLTHKKTGMGFYKRMEIFKATPWRRDEVRRMWVIFKDNIFKDAIVICVMRGKRLYRVRLNSPH